MFSVNQKKINDNRKNIKVTFVQEEAESVSLHFHILPFQGRTPKTLSCDVFRSNSNTRQHKNMNHLILPN